MSLSEETLSLQRAAHDLMYLGMDGSPQLCIIPASKVPLLKNRLTSALLF